MLQRALKRRPPKTHRWRQITPPPLGTFVAPTVQHGKTCPTQANPPTIPPKLRKVSKRWASTSKEIILVHVSSYILKIKRYNISGGAKLLPPPLPPRWTFIAPHEILCACVSVKLGELPPPPPAREQKTA